MSSTPQDHPTGTHQAPSSGGAGHHQPQQQQPSATRPRKRVQQPSARMTEMSLDFRKDSLQFSDVTLLVGAEKQRLRSHRILLSLWSPVFRAMLTNSCQEQQSQTINLPEDSAETVELMLRAFYTPGGCDIDYQGALSLLPLVHRLQVEQLIRECEEKLLRNLKDDTVFSALELADRFDLAALKRYATDFCCALPIELLESKAEELCLSAETLVLILKKKIRHLQGMVEEMYLSTKRSVTRVEGKIQKIPLNHCSEHELPRLGSEELCGQCAASTIGYLQELCSKALNRDLAHS